MKTRISIAAAAMCCFSATSKGAPPNLTPADEAAAFKAAGFKQQGKQWRQCEDPTPSYTPGEVAELRDLNGDGRPEALITEGGTFCFGSTGAGYTLVSKQADGSWKKLTGGTGMVTFLPTKARTAGPISRSAAPVSAFLSNAGTAGNTC